MTKLTEKQQQKLKEYNSKKINEVIEKTQQGAKFFEEKNPLAAQLLRALDSNTLIQRASEKQKLNPRKGSKLFDEIEFSINEVWKRKLNE